MTSITNRMLEEGNNPSNQTKDCRDLPQFTALPPELRLMIWRYAIQSIAEVVDLPFRRQASGIPQSPRVPLAFVNKEAYSELNLTTMRYKQRKFVMQLDAVWLRNVTTLCPGKEIQLCLRNSKPILRFAITIEVWRHSLEMNKLDGDDFWDLVFDIGVQELVVVVAFTAGRPTPLGGRFITGEGRRLEKPQYPLCTCVPQSSEWTSWEKSEERSTTILKKIWSRSQQSRHWGRKGDIPTVRFCSLVASPLDGQTYRSICTCGRTCWRSPSTPSVKQVQDKFEASFLSVL